jgi:hypothetical protein
MRVYMRYRLTSPEMKELHAIPHTPDGQPVHGHIAVCGVLADHPYRAVQGDQEKRGFTTCALCLEKMPRDIPDGNTPPPPEPVDDNAQFARWLKEASL